MIKKSRKIFFWGLTRLSTKRARTPGRYTKRMRNIIQFLLENIMNIVALCKMDKIKQKTIKGVKIKRVAK